MSHFKNFIRRTTYGLPAQKSVGLSVLVVILMTLGVAGTRWWLLTSNHLAPPKNNNIHPVKNVTRDQETSSQSEIPDSIHLPKDEWSYSGIEVESAQSKPFTRSVRLTGKVTLNQDKIAHIYPMVEGSVNQVTVSLGQTVKADDLLVVIHSREIGRAKLELYQARLQHEMAIVKDNLQVEITANARELLVALREEKAITEIEKQFRSRGMGNYRERLLLAYSNYLKSDADVQRLEGLGESGAISAKQLYAAQSNRNADQATYQARIEQIDYELTTDLLLSSQAVKEADTRVAVAATNLRILGCEEKDLEKIDPVHQGESISNYPIRAPFDGTVITKDVALREQVRLDSQVLSIADLSSVWITADVYEEHVPLLTKQLGKTIEVHNEAWPDQIFEAKIFYTGEIMEETTRTIAMRAITDNKDHLLKPGMFVNIELPLVSEVAVVQLPTSAIQEHQGKQFVFIPVDDENFEVRPLKVGNADRQFSVIDEGIRPDERVVTKGGFILKSKLLAELMGEE